MSCFVSQKNVFKKKILQMLLMTSYACNKAKTDKNYKQVQKSGYRGEGGKAKVWGKAARPITLFFKKRYSLRDYDKKLNVCSV